ncbi:AIG1 family protein [Entamoeba histolytica]|uniref:AIG1 family protein n=2 Tax=Entamoeba histolytica TaxID=5759 RepID=C4M5W8_ENTH1|nr:AIG1 family protein [Entamoeba histolytica HM-1:IMSS]EAL43340.1 AIG1 family protein [Entamoeba histolytica HM-1:IMSS]GAT96839.1 AIG1 family protein [Entamoeba histolytica]|eukprot:XP_648726.1 AIG1 family protein [Entamoeba histolytica HM-1:IMSS]
MSVSEDKPKQTKFLLIGETGNGKSSLVNFILQKNVFEVSDDTKSQTKEAIVKSGEGDRSDVTVIDTPGFNDSDKLDKTQIQNIVDCIKNNGLQGIILTIDINKERFSANLKFIVKVISDVFTIKDIWKRVCIVWTKCPNSFGKEKDKIEKEQFKEDLISFIKQMNGTNETIDIPMYFVYSQPDEDDCKNERSNVAIKKMIEWGRGLKLINTEEINKLVSEYKDFDYEEKEEKGKTIEETKSSITYEIKKCRRINKIKKNETVINGEWIEVSSRNKTENKSNEGSSFCVVM